MRQSTVFAILIAILNKRKVTQDYLAERFEISRRSVSRYIDIIAEAGIPIYSIRGPMGGYCIQDSYRLERTFLLPEEKERIITSLEASRSNWSDKISDNALEKIKNISNDDECGKFLINSQTLIIDNSQWSQDSKHRIKISKINEAIESKLTIDVSYVNRHGIKSVRAIDPYALVLKQGVWYTFGYCHLKQELRLFMLARIRGFTLTGQTYQRKECDVYAAINEDMKVASKLDIEIEFFATVLPEMEEWLGGENIIDRGNVYYASSTVYGDRAAISKILSFGGSARVISPPHIRSAVMSECAQMVDFNQLDNGILFNKTNKT